jgi:hypothetical protein
MDEPKTTIVAPIPVLVDNLNLYAAGIKHGKQSRLFIAAQEP